MVLSTLVCWAVMTTLSPLASQIPGCDVVPVGNTAFALDSDRRTNAVVLALDLVLIAWRNASDRLIYCRVSRGCYDCKRVASSLKRYVVSHDLPSVPRFRSG